MKKCTKVIITAMSLVNVAANALPIQIAKTVVPVGNSAFIYDGRYDANGNKLAPVAGLFVTAIKNFNAGATASAHKLNQLFPYGGDMEMYCAGSGGSDPSAPCLPKSFLVTYYPPETFNSTLNNWANWQTLLGDSGFRSTQLYSQITGISKKIINIDGRVDLTINGNADSNYLDQLNTLDQTDAANFADIVAKNICADDTVDGVLFDIEPFSFTGVGGSYQGQGQQYFYTQIAKNFGGWHANSTNPGAINTWSTSPTYAKDPLGCVDAKHPHGRTFGVFTFAKNVTSAVVKTLTYNQNGYVVDSLYDLAPTPGGTCTLPTDYVQLVSAEVAAMAAINIPFQFAIPTSASSHEFVSTTNVTSCATDQDQYIQAALAAIHPVRTNGNFKGMVIWSWNEALWWNGIQLFPATPPESVISDLQANM